jgi:hypothetical protein
VIDSDALQDGENLGSQDTYSDAGGIFKCVALLEPEAW